MRINQWSNWWATNGINSWQVSGLNMYTNASHVHNHAPYSASIIVSQLDISHFQSFYEFWRSEEKDCWCPISTQAINPLRLNMLRLFMSFSLSLSLSFSILVSINAFLIQNPKAKEISNTRTSGVVHSIGILVCYICIWLHINECRQPVCYSLSSVLLCSFHNFSLPWGSSGGHISHPWRYIYITTNNIIIVNTRFANFAGWSTT